MIPEGELSDRKEELNGYISSLEEGLADVLVLKKLAHLCRQNPVNEPISPISPDFSDPSSPSPLFGRTRTLPSLKSDFWHQDKTFERLFNVLVQYLDPARVRGFYVPCGSRITALNDGTVCIDCLCSLRPNWSMGL